MSRNCFRNELRARRRLLWISPGEWLLNLLYQWFSGYGSGFYRPLLWLVAVFVIGAAFFACAPLYCGASMPNELAIRLSFANILVFLPIQRETMSRISACLSNTILVVCAAQSLLSVVLFFLLGLGLRNRFRMK
jgi:hypothetical protein